MVKALAPDDVAELLASWHRLNAGILQVSEAGLLQLIAVELKNQARPRFLGRLHHRYNRVRFLRESQMLARRDKGWRQ